jgi:hypothetical protein
MELNLTDDESTLYYQLFDQEYQNRMETKKKKVHFHDNDHLSNTNFSFGQFQSMFIPSRHLDTQLEIKPTINSEDFSQLGLYLFSSWLWYDNKENLEENFRCYLRLLHLKNDDLVLLCLHSLLSIPLSLPKSIEIWKKIFSIIYSINQNKNLIQITMEKTTNSLTAFLLTLIFRLYDNEINLPLLIRRLSALIAIQNLYLSIKNTNEQDQAMNEFTVERIFIKHRHDYLLELITRRIIEANIPSSWLTMTAMDSKENSFHSKIHKKFRTYFILFFMKFAFNRVTIKIVL